MNVNCKEDAQLRPCAGHGLDFFAEEHNEPGSLIALLRGFEWLHEGAEAVEILIRPPDDTYDAVTLADARRTFEGL